MGSLCLFAGTLERVLPLRVSGKQVSGVQARLAEEWIGGSHPPQRFLTG